MRPLCWPGGIDVTYHPFNEEKSSRHGGKLRDFDFYALEMDKESRIAFRVEGASVARWDEVGGKRSGEGEVR
jgi:hypothetical protein